jgi:hypothetical protein
LEQQHVGDEADKVFHRNIVIHQLRQQLSKNISDDQNQAQHRNREQNIHDQFAANKSIDQLHPEALTLAQKI